ncbi:MAG: glycosyltransferase family 4 protein [Candidatus Aminicenantia bacterium]
MKILMIAPEPFFQPRGTPFSEYFRTYALSRLGHQVDLITYPMGDDVKIENLKIIRGKFPFIKSIKIGPSLKKIPLDISLFLKTLLTLISQKYDLIYTHEEASFFGIFLSKLFKLPHIYDMHSSLPQQLQNFQFSRSKILSKIFSFFEKFVLKNSHCVIVICKDLENHAKKITDDKKIIRIENFLDFHQREIKDEEVKKLRNDLNIINEKVILYAGTFEPYQGIDVLIKATNYLKKKDFLLILIGGNKKQIEAMKSLAESLGVKEKVIFTGEKKPEEIPIFLSISNVLVSPRISGTNTPLKIYSYLKSGKPIVATNLWTHTQILNNEIAILVKPEPEEIARGIEFALTDKGKEIAKKAKEYSEKEFTEERYISLIDLALKIAFENFKAN